MGRSHPMTMPMGWASWTPEETRVENVISGWTGVVVAVMNRGAGNNKVKVRWDKNGHVGWNNPANLKAIK